jgi:hypothetical protein
MAPCAMPDTARTQASDAGHHEPSAECGPRVDAWSDITVSKERRSRQLTRSRAGRLSIVFPGALAAPCTIHRDAFVLGRRGDGQVRHPTVSRAHLEIA